MITIPIPYNQTVPGRRTLDDIVEEARVAGKNIAEFNWVGDYGFEVDVEIRFKAEEHPNGPTMPKFGREVE